MPPPGDLSDPGIKPTSPEASLLQLDSLPWSQQRGTGQLEPILKSNKVQTQAELPMRIEPFHQLPICSFSRESFLWQQRQQKDLGRGIGRPEVTASALVRRDPAKAKQGGNRCSPKEREKAEGRLTPKQGSKIPINSYHISICKLSVVEVGAELSESSPPNRVVIITKCIS